MAAVTDQMAPGAHVARKTPKGTFDIVFRNASFLSALFVLLLLAGIMVSMVIGGWPAFREFGLGFITSSVWDTQNEQYGAWPAIVGTLSTALIALLIGVSACTGQDAAASAGNEAAKAAEIQRIQGLINDLQGRVASTQAAADKTASVYAQAQMAPVNAAIQQATAAERAARSEGFAMPVAAPAPICADGSITAVG